MDNNILNMEVEEIEKLYKDITKNLKRKLATYLGEIEFPIRKKVSYTGPTVSKVNNPVFWLDKSEKQYKLCSNLVPNKYDNAYIADLKNPEHIKGIIESFKPVVKSFLNKKEAQSWIENGGDCIYRYGWEWKGAGAKYLTKEDALKMFPTYSFGKGFYELSWTTMDGKKVLEFNKLSENDMW